MKLNKNRLSAFLIVGVGLTGLKAQQSLSSSGKDVSGSGGTVNYTIGQVDYINSTSASGQVYQGVQQPYEIFAVGLNELSNISLTYMVYPNPTAEFLDLDVSDASIEHLSLSITDISGKVLLQSDISENKTKISMQSYSSGTYFLQITAKNKNLKSFKIIKN